jgi:dTDP-4-dehydrorhamnose reductase
MNILLLGNTGQVGLEFQRMLAPLGKVTEHTINGASVGAPTFARFLADSTGESWALPE